MSQLTEATLKGTVTDPTGSGVARASVTAINDRTGQKRSADSDEHGGFSLPELPPGVYTVTVRVPRFKLYEQKGLELNVGKTAEVNVRLELGDLEQTIEVSAEVAKVPVSTEGRLSDTLEHTQITELPLAQRDVFGLPRLSAGATNIPGSAFSFKLGSSPTITVNGNRYRGNNYVLDGAMDTDTINTGEPAIVPSLESIEEVQVQTGNFSSEFGRGNGAVVNLRTKSGTNEFHGRAWEFHRNAALDARNFFAAETPEQVFNQFGANLGGPLIKNRTFFFGSYEGTRNAFGEPLELQVETPEFRNYVFDNDPASVAAGLLKKFPAPTPSAGSGGQRYQNEVDITTPQGALMPAIGSAAVNLHGYNRYDQYLTRVDHMFNSGKDTLTGRWIAEYQRSDGATPGYSPSLAKVARGFREPYAGFFGDLNIGEVHVFKRMVNDARLAFHRDVIDYEKPFPDIPEVDITGINAPLGSDPWNWGTHYRTYELRDTVSLDRAKHLVRAGVEGRKIFEGIYLGTPTAGTFYFNSLLDFAADRPYQQGLVVNPSTGEPAPLAHYYILYEYAAFVQDDWKVSSRLTLNLGARQDYFGSPSERYGHLSSIIFGPGSTWDERLANASVGHVNQLFTPRKLNLSPRVGLAYDPFGDGKSSVRAGFSIAYQPPHGYSINGASANPPDGIQAVLQPNVGIGSTILYGIPVPFNPEFQTTLNSQGGVVSAPGEPPIRIWPWIVNPKIKTQYSESWFFNIQREVARNWIVELGYVGTNGINLERIEDINRFTGDLVVNGGVQKRINPNFGAMTFITNGVNSSYNGMTAEVRHRAGANLTLQANYRWSKWLDDNSDTSPHLLPDDPEGIPGAQDVSCLRCERGRSMFDIPHRFTASALWTPAFLKGQSLVDKIGKNWQISAIIAAQSGRPFSVWCSASFQAGCDYNADGGGAIFGGSYDRPDAPLPGAIKSSFSKQDYLNGLFNPNVFPKPAPGTNGTLGRDVFRGPHQVNADVSVARSFSVAEGRLLQLRFEGFNVLNFVNLYLPNSDLALALQPGGTFSSTSAFGKSTQAFDARILQVSAKFIF